MEHRFTSRGRVVGVVTIRGLFLSKGGPVAPAVFLRAFGMDRVSPALPSSVIPWSQSCDLLSEAIRDQENQAGGICHTAS